MATRQSRYLDPETCTLADIVSATDAQRLQLAKHHNLASQSSKSTATNNTEILGRLTKIYANKTSKSPSKSLLNTNDDASYTNQYSSDEHVQGTEETLKLILHRLEKLDSMNAILIEMQKKQSILEEDNKMQKALNAQLISRIEKLEASQPVASTQVVSNISKKLQELSNREEEADKAEQEAVRLDVRVTGDEGCNALNDTPPEELKNYCQESLSQWLHTPASKISIAKARIVNPRPSNDGKPRTPSMVITFADMDTKLHILKHKTHLRTAAPHVRITSELTKWQVKRKSERWEEYKTLKEQGENVFFLGHRLMTQKTGDRKSRIEIKAKI